MAQNRVLTHHVMRSRRIGQPIVLRRDETTASGTEQSYKDLNPVAAIADLSIEVAFADPT